MTIEAENIIEVDFLKKERVIRLKNDALKASIRGDHQSLQKIIDQLREFLDNDQVHSFLTEELEKCVIAKGD